MSHTNKNIVNSKDRVGVAQKLSYSIGFAGKDGFTTIVNSYLMLFLMTIGGLAPTFIGLMMLGARIWDAVNDPILGSIADHTNTKWGKFRPYMFSAIPMAIIFAALFFVPDLSNTGRMVYYTIVYVLYGMCFTVLEIPYFGLVSAMTKDPEERASITAWSRIISRIPAIALPLALAYLTVQLGEEKGYFVNAIIIGAIAVIAAFISFFGCKEKALIKSEPAAQKASSFQDFLNVIKGNRALLIVMLVQLFFTFNTILADMLNTYYVTYSLGSPGLITGLAVSLVAVGACIGQFAYPYVLRYVKSCKRLMMIGIPIYAALLALCYISGNISIPMYLVFLVASNLFTGALQINVINLCFEVCDVLEYKNGVRADATVFAVVSFLMKLAAGFASTIAGWGLALVGFTGGLGPVQGEVTQAMANGVAILRFALPGGLALISLLLVFLYPITKNQIEDVRIELLKRHNEE